VWAGRAVGLAAGGHEALWEEGGHEAFWEEGGHEAFWEEGGHEARPYWRRGGGMRILGA